MSPDPESAPQQMTMDAIKAAREISDRLNDEILAEALRLSSGSEVTAKDVSHAYRVIQSRSYLWSPDEISILESARVSKQYIRSAWLLVGVSGALGFIALTFTLLESGLLDSGLALFVPLTAALLGSLVVTLTVSTRLLDAKRRTDQVSWVMRRPQQRTPTASMAQASKNDGTGRTTPDLIGRAQFLDSWFTLERALRQLAVKEAGGPEEQIARMPNGEVFRALSRHGILDEKASERFRLALSARNSIVHGGDISDEELRSAADATAKLVHYIHGKYPRNSL